MATAKLKADKTQLMCLLVRSQYVTIKHIKIPTLLETCCSSETLLQLQTVAFKIPVMICIYVYIRLFQCKVSITMF